MTYATKDVIKEETYHLIFEKEVTAHCVGEIACKVLGLNMTDIKGIYGFFKSEYSISKKEENYLKLLFSIKFKKNIYKL